ncbi:hypothetical protein BofuT4_uP099640.1 [Botrytis cinerea T4]|uniref:Uncharacterized protein n=1 Tax=Botryotinia fuckeliana (strain T4) TaxID=999810 RepID=G2YC84_BOTF4|nr:hypothetical protein BofuT4_uP099640.1 [Botrytis cinerea T4]
MACWRSVNRSQSNHKPNPMVRPPPLRMRIIELMAPAPTRLDELRTIGILFRTLKKGN